MSLTSWNAGAIEATITLDRSPFQRGLDEAKAEAKRFEDETFRAKLDVTGDQQSKQKIDAVEVSARKLAASNPKVTVDADTLVTDAKILKVQDKIAALNRARANPKIDADIEAAQRAIMLVEGRLQRIAETKTGVELEVETAKAQAQIDALRFKLDGLSSKRVTIDVDIAGAEAQLAALQASAAGAGDAAEGAGGQLSAMAAGIMALFPPASTTVLSLTGALELAAAPMVAIQVGMTGIQAAAAPLAGEFLELQSVVSATFENGLKSAVTDVSALMPTLQDGLVGTAAALSTVATGVGQVVSSAPGLEAVQASFSNIQSVILASAPGLAGFTQNVLDLGVLGTGSLTGLSGIVNDLSVQWHDLIANLTSSGEAQTAIQSLVSALGAAAAVVPPLVQAGVQLMAVIGPPLAGALNLVAGTAELLAGPLGGLTTTVLAGVIAWKAATVAAGLFQAGLARIGIGAAAAATASSAATAGAVAWLPAASGATAGAGRLATGLATVGRAFPLVAVGVIAAYAAVKSFTTSTDEAVAAMAKGGQAAEDMRAKVASQTSDVKGATTGIGEWASGVNEWINTEVFGIATMKNTQAALDKHRASLTELQRAQEDATVAAGDYQQAVDKYGPKSTEAAAAQQKLAEATLRVSTEQGKAAIATANVGAAMQAANSHFGDQAQKIDGLSQSTISYANALASLAQPLGSAGDKVKAFAADVQGASDAPRTLLDTMNAADKSITSFAESTLKISPAMIDASGAINTATKAGQELATGISGSASAYDNLRGAVIASAQANGDTMPTALAKGGLALEQFRQKLVDQAIQHGATREQAQGLVDTYFAFPPSIKTEISQPGMVQAYADALGLKGAIVGIPDDKSVIVKTLTADAQKQLEDLGFKVTKLPNGQILITADGSSATATTAETLAAIAKQRAEIPLSANPAQFNTALADIKGQLAGAPPAPIPVTADAVPFNTALADAKGRMATPGPPIPLNGDPTQFYGVVESSKLFAGTSLAVVPLDANPESFNGKVTASITLADGSVGTIALDGNPALVNGKTTQAVSFADGSKGTITLEGNPDPVTGRINAVVDLGNGKHTTITIDPKDLASSVIAAIPRTITTTVTIVTVGATVPAGTSGSVRVGGAGGGLVGFAGGGVIPDGARHMATGGVMPGYAPGVDNIPAILSPGEAVLVPELVKRLGPGNILAANMAASGRQPTFWNGARPQGGDGVALGPLTVGGQVSSGNLGAVLEQFAARIEQAVTSGTRNGDASAALASKVDDLVGEIRRSGAGAQIVVNDRSGNPVETAREAMLRARLRR